MTYVDPRPTSELSSAALARDAAFREAHARETFRRIMAAPCERSDCAFGAYPAHRGTCPTWPESRTYDDGKYRAG